jgi:hypothetical protein
VSTDLSADRKIALRMAIEGNLTAISALSDEIREHPGGTDGAWSTIDARLERIAETLRSTLETLDE